MGLEYGFFIDTTNYYTIRCTVRALPVIVASRVAVSPVLCHGPARALFQAPWYPMPRRFGSPRKPATQSPPSLPATQSHRVRTRRPVREGVASKIAKVWVRSSKIARSDELDLRRLHVDGEDCSVPARAIFVERLRTVPVAIHPIGMTAHLARTTAVLIDGT